MDEMDKHEVVKRYATLKKRKAVLEDEMNRLRDQIIGYCEQRQVTEFVTGLYRVKLMHQERKEYDDRKLYEALSDPGMWRQISKADSGKIASMLKLNVITAQVLSDTYTSKRIALLQVEKQ
ncbi:hypothetical protein [Paenibacillus darwinianus]|nr:hypothetical protein [Paenibacillus darwinianus]